MHTYPTNTPLTGLTGTWTGLPMVTSFLRLFLVPFTLGIERPTEATAGNGGGMNHEDKMKVLAALELLSSKVEASGQTLSAPEIEIYENALRVIGPID